MSELLLKLGTISVLDLNHWFLEYNIFDTSYPTHILDRFAHATNRMFVAKLVSVG